MARLPVWQWSKKRVTMGEPSSSVLRGHHLRHQVNSAFQGLLCPCRDSTQPGLDLRPTLLDGIELGRIRQSWCGDFRRGRAADIPERITFQVNVQNIVFDYQFRKPLSFSVRIIKGHNAGVILNWNGGTTVQATPTSRSLDNDDSRIVVR